MNGYGNLLKKYKIYKIISLGVALAIWQVIAALVVKNPFILPSFTETITSLYSLIA